MPAPIGITSVNRSTRALRRPGPLRRRLPSALALALVLAAASAMPAGAKDAYVAYTGPARPDTEVSTLMLEGVDWLRIDTTRVKKSEHAEVKLLPGMVRLEWGRKMSGRIFPEEFAYADSLVLEAGHAYAVNIDRKHVFGQGYDYFPWIEDTNTGYVVAGMKLPSRMSAEEKKNVRFSSADQAKLMRAAGEGDLETLRALVEGGIDVDLRDRGNQTALFHAAKSGRVNAIEFLIAHGADVDARDERDQTALMFASLHDPKAVSVLLDAGADPNLELTEPYGSTALMCAAAEGTDEDTVESIRRLLAHPETDVNASGTEGQTALMYAAGMKSLEVIRLLLAHGADVNAVDAHGRSALDWAKGSGTKKLLREAGAKKGKELR